LKFGKVLMDDNIHNQNLKSRFSFKNNYGSLKLFIISICFLSIVFYFLGQQKNKYSKKNSNNYLSKKITYAPSLLSLNSEYFSNNSYIVVKDGTGSKDDIFVFSNKISNGYRNLTNSPSEKEIFPVLDKQNEYIAFFGIGKSDINLYWLKLSNGNSISLTLRAGDSKLHTNYVIDYMKGLAISTDNSWIAFIASHKKNKDVSELFVAHCNGQKVMQISQLSYTIRDYIWLDENTIIFTTDSNQQKVMYWKAAFDLNKFKVEMMK